jgi:hypothetical protein
MDVSLSFSPHEAHTLSFAGIAAVQIWQMRFPLSSGLRSALKSVWIMKWYCLRVTGWWCHPMHLQQSQCTRDESSIVSSYTRIVASYFVPFANVTVWPRIPPST